MCGSEGHVIYLFLQTFLNCNLRSGQIRPLLIHLTPKLSHTIAFCIMSFAYSKEYYKKNHKKLIVMAAGRMLSKCCPFLRTSGLRNMKSNVFIQWTLNPVNDSLPYFVLATRKFKAIFPALFQQMNRLRSLHLQKEMLLQFIILLSLSLLSWILFPVLLKFFFL